MRDLLALLPAAIVAGSLLRWAYRRQPCAPVPVGAAVAPATLAVAAMVALLAAAALDAGFGPSAIVRARDLLLLFAAVLAVLAAVRRAESAPRLLGRRHRLLNDDLPMVAGACALIGGAALRIQHGASVLDVAISGGAAALVAGLVPALYAATRLRAGGDGGGAGVALAFAATLALGLAGVLPHVA